MKHLYSLTFIIFLVFISYSCKSDPVKFNEIQWQNKVETTDASLLYKSNFKNGKYFNPWGKMERKGFSTMMKWRFSKKPEYTDYEQNYLPKIIPDTKERILKTKGDFILWIGHNTFLMRLNGIYWITDPMLTKKAVVVKRVTPPAISIKEINEITDSINIIITHNHYDHLDKETIKSLPSGGNDIVPMGLKNMLESFGRKNVKEMNWWQDAKISNDFKITCLPVQHWSKRIGQSTNSVLWASYMLTSPKYTFYIGGDSGYFPGYKEIGKKFKDIDYAFMPATAYIPRWFMHYSHMNIEETLKAFEQIKAKYFIPTQWGTFKLADEPAGYPGLDLKREIDKQKLDKSKFLIMDIGEILELP